MKLKFYIALLFGVVAIQAISQPLFKAKLDTNQTLIGMPVTFSLYAEIESGAEFLWPIITDSLNGLEVWEKSEIKNSTQNGIQQISQSFLVSAFDSGFYIIKPIALKLGLDSILTEPILVQVNTIALSEEKELFDIKAPKTVAYPWLNVVLLAAGGLLILGLIIYFIHKRKKKDQPLKPLVTDLRTPLEKLRDSIKKIRTEKRWEQNPKAFYTDLSESIKTYMELEEGIAALESTTQEVTPEIMALAWTKEQKVQIVEMLKEADMVKFAKAKSSIEFQIEHLQNLENLYQALYAENELKNVKNNTVNG